MERKRKLSSIPQVALFTVWMGILAWVGVGIQKVSSSLCAVAFLGVLFALYFYTRGKLEQGAGTNQAGRVDLFLLLATLVGLLLVSFSPDGSMVLGNTDTKLMVVALAAFAGTAVNYYLAHREGETIG